MEYGQVCKYLDDCLIFGIKPGLVRVKKILELLDNPQKKVEFIHVVGTNGKTSTTRITAGILKYHGIKTGYYISPHIKRYTERIWINGKDIPEKKFSKTFNRIYPYIEQVNKMNLEGPLTQFEIITVMAFMQAEDEGIEAMVLEAGMGGRWDATNAADSKIAGLTGVSLEHTELLGDTLEKIASEKVEVIKKNAMVATTCCNKEVLKILIRKVKDTDSTLFMSGRDFYMQKKKNLGTGGWLLDIKGLKGTYRDLKLPLPGNYQILNLMLATVLAELYLKTRNKELDEKKVRESLKCLKTRGRFEIIRKRPVIIADAGHNPEGIENFTRTVNDYFGSRRKIIILAVLKDKDYESMVEKIIGVSDVLILTSSMNERSLDTGRLEEVVKEKIRETPGNSGRGIELHRIEDIEKSIKFALKISGINDIICITGSITNLENIVK
jgi:dihydrofolate synthase / folylpolyglutamate synthase